MAQAVPIQNLYYLFCYAWGHFREGKGLAVDATIGPNTFDLLATVLINGVRRLLRRGIDRGYVAFEEDLRNIRGRISFGTSLKQALFINGRASCFFDDLNHDILQNQIIKATINSLKKAEGIDPSIRNRLQEIDRYLRDVTLIRLQKNDFGRIQLHRNNSFYDLLLKICELIFDCSLPSESTGRTKFKDISRDEIRLSSVFEEFVRKFYHLEQKNYRVHRANIDWSVSEASEQDIAYLPVMKTDICLESSRHTIIMDTKFYRNSSKIMRVRRSSPPIYINCTPT
jgi:5-methylcytosine-specific restriction enzyme subunit McrC